MTKESLMRYDLLELPQVLGLLIKVQMMDDIIVRKNIFVLIIIDRSEEAKKFGIVRNLFVMRVDGFYDAFTKLLTIILLVHEEGATNKPFRIYNGHRIQL